MRFFNKPKIQNDEVFDYLLLLLMLAAAALVARFLQLTGTALLVLTVFVSVGYVVWGILHHKKGGHIDQKVVLEYVSLAALVNIIIFTLVI